LLAPSAQKMPRNNLETLNFKKTGKGKPLSLKIISGEKSQSATNKSCLVISALGKDHSGIVNDVSKSILDSGCNIVDSRMSILGGEFALMLMIEGNWNTLAKVESGLKQLEQSMGLTIISTRTENRVHTQNLVPYIVEVVALDHPGIVHQLANFFTSHSINIEDLNTTTYAAAHTGAKMFSVNMTIEIQAETHIPRLRDEFLDFCDQLNLDAIIEPVKG